MSYKRVIHRYWAGPRDMPQKYVEFGEKWEDLNPGWIVMDHSEEVLQLWPDLADIFNYLYGKDAGGDSPELHAQVSDIVGYALIREFGGVYVDCDIEPVESSIEPKLPNMAWASYGDEETWEVSNSAIGAPRPHDPFWEKLLLELPRDFFRNSGAVSENLLTVTAKNHHGEVYIFPKWFFNTTDSPMAMAVRHHNSFEPINGGK